MNAMGPDCALRSPLIPFPSPLQCPRTQYYFTTDILAGTTVPFTLISALLYWANTTLKVPYQFAPVVLLYSVNSYDRRGTSEIAAENRRHTPDSGRK